MIAFDAPLWLLAVPLAWLVWRTRPTTRRVRAARAAGRRRLTQRDAAALARGMAVALLALALAGPRVGLPSNDVDTVFLVDASDSVGAAGRAEALAWMREAMGARDDGDRGALALFGREPRLEHGLRADPPQGAPAVVVDGSASDLAAAVRLGLGVLGGDARRRAVLLTDGRQTEGDLLAAAEELATLGIGLDVVPLGSAGVADLLVEEVRAPNRVREGESYEVVGVLRNTGATAADAVVVVLADGRELERREVTVPPGRSEVPVDVVAQGTGTVRYEMRLLSGDSPVPDNDVGRAAVQVQGPPRVLVVEGAAGLGAELTQALSSAAVPAERRAMDQGGLPPLDRLLDFDSAVLVDVPAALLGVSGMAALDSYVRDAGHGLVVVGGEHSYGMGAYDGTPLEDLIPVFASVTDPKKRPNVAQGLVVDTSGSMAACHCADDQAFGRAEQGGVVKTDIAKEAISRAIAALEAQDQIGVLAYNEGSEWVLPLQALPSLDVVDDALSRLHPSGGTQTVPALRKAIEGLKDAEARLRHIVLFTDGFEPDAPRMVDVAREAREQGITLSVVATGEGDMSVLEEVAEAGGGRFYPGRDLFSIPDIVALEVQFAARPIVNEGQFLPRITGTSAATDRLDAAPPLQGYLATSAKPTARTLLTVGEQHDPLLATWRAGLGTATAWTSDATARWSAQWVGWDQYSRFWADVVKETFPERGDPGFGLEAGVTPDGVRVVMRVDPSLPADAEAAATVTGPDGERSRVRLTRVALDRFEGLVPAAAEGIYGVTGRLTVAGQPGRVDAVTALRSYSAEYAVSEADPSLLRRAAEAAGGRVGPEPHEVFDAAGLAPGSARTPLWPWLAALALLLAVADVGLRRLRLERADFRLRGRGRPSAGNPARQGTRDEDAPGQPTEPGTPAGTPEEAAAEPPPTGMQGLLAARDRARRRDRP